MQPTADAAADAPAVPATGPAAAFRLMRHRDFGPYFFGNALSASGTWFQNLAASILVYRLTHSAFLLGVLNFVQFIPILVLAPWAGAAADRVNRRHLLLATQFTAATLSFSLAVLTWAGIARVWVVILFGLASGVTIAFTTPAASAMIASIVPRNELASAVGLNSMTYNLARAVGPTLAQPAIATLGIAAAFAINAASYLALAAAVLAIRPHPQTYASRAESRLRDSFVLLRRQPRLLVYLAIVLVVGFASDPVNTEAVAFAREFGRPDTQAGFLIGIFGAGAVAAAFLLAGRVAGSVRRITIMLALLAAGIVAFALVPTFWLVFVPLAVAGFGYLAANTAATSRLQLEVSDAQRGRIMALWGVAFLGFRPFASLLDGTLAAAFGVRVAAVALAVPAALVALALSSYRKSQNR